MVYTCCRHLLAKAPSRHIVELARAEVRNNPMSTKEMKEFANIRLEDSEVGVHQIFQRYGFSCKLNVGSVNLGADELKSFPYILFSTWILFLGLKQICRRLVGVPTVAKMILVLREFWARFKFINGNHEIFQMANSNEVDLDYVIPYFSHSDEGRSYKKEALWIFSVHGCVGRGTRNYLKAGKHKAPLRRNQMGLNFVGQSWSTQFLFATMLRETSNNNPEAMGQLLRIFSGDAASLARDCIVVGGCKLWFLHLGTKGDLPGLGKVGHFKRTFSHCPRAPTSKKHCTGICHQCLGGQEASVAAGTVAYPYEDLSNHPCWENTINAVDPWMGTPEILLGLPINNLAKCQFFCFDVWHVFHLGIAKHFLASSFAMIVESRLPALAGFRSIDAKFQWITERYRQYCKSNKLSMWVREINKDSLQWPQSSACPIGKWNKGAASTAIMLFLGEFCKRYIKGISDDESLLLIATCWLWLNFPLCFVAPFLVDIVFYIYLVCFSMPLSCHCRLTPPFRWTLHFHISILPGSGCKIGKGNVWRNACLFSWALTNDWLGWRLEVARIAIKWFQNCTIWYILLWKNNGKHLYLDGCKIAFPRPYNVKKIL